MSNRRSPKPPTHAPAIGQKVDYFELLGSGRPVIRPSHPGVVVNSETRLLGGHTWVVGIEGKAGAVALEHCKPSKDEPAPWPVFTPMREYKVTWQIELTAASAREAAESAYTMQREALGPQTFHCEDEFGIKSRIDLSNQRAAELVTAEEIEASGGRIDATHHLRGRK